MFPLTNLHVHFNGTTLKFNVWLTNDVLFKISSENNSFMIASEGTRSLSIAFGHRLTQTLFY